ncbi:hypothetical protein [Streptococcus intermedius]|uniref:hypothetical protein n=1 Tax=Streptococcus intermedius TaxID=1338 RepID=UPI000E3DEDC0|nr:hypothetical protein [Streptococcus intermedius]
MMEAWRGTNVLIYIPSSSHLSIVCVPRSENSVIAAEKFGIKHFIFVGLFVDQVDRLFHMGNVKINFISWEESVAAIIKLAMSPVLHGKIYILTQGRNYTC